MAKTKQADSKKAKKIDDCTIPPEIPKDQLHKLMFQQSETEAQGIRDYVEWQSRRDNEKALHA